MRQQKLREGITEEMAFKVALEGWVRTEQAEIKGGCWKGEVFRKRFRQRKEHEQVWRLR